jgi:hypothetical protein
MDTLKQAELNQVKNLEEKTGKKIAEWIEIAQKSGFEKHGEILNYLKNNIWYWARVCQPGSTLCQPEPCGCGGK